MWECLSKIWDWFGSNAGQVQILIAVVALVYARRAYLKVVEQIAISNKQTQKAIDQEVIANKQRIFELRLKVTSLLFDSNSRCKAIITNYKNVIAEFDFFIKDNKSTESEKNQNLLKKIESLVESLKKLETRIKTIEGEIQNLSKGIKDIEILDLANLEKFLITITTLSGKIDGLSQSPERYLISLKKFKRFF